VDRVANYVALRAQCVESADAVQHDYITTALYRSIQFQMNRQDCNLVREGVYCRPNWLIFSYFVKTWEFMATGSSQRAMKFSAEGHVVTWRPDFWGKKYPSEMHGKIVTPISWKRCVLEPKEQNFKQTTPQM